MPEAILYVIAGFLGLVFVVRSIIDATMKINLQIHEKNQQVNKENEMALDLAQLKMGLNTTLQEFRSEFRDFKTQAAKQETLDNIARFLTEKGQELHDLQEAATLVKVNTGRIASIERHIIAVHTLLASDSSNQSMLPFPFPIPQLPPSNMGPGGMWKPLGIKRDGDKYKTEDGEHEADSLEELLAKLAGDPQYRIDPNFKRINPADIEDMRKMFEGELDEHDDDDDEKEDWQKDKE